MLARGGCFQEYSTFDSDWLYIALYVCVTLVSADLSEALNRIVSLVYILGLVDSIFEK